MNNVMPEIRYRCPTCGDKLCVDEAAAGMQILCPQCRTTGIVPRPGPPGRLLSVDMRFRCPHCTRKIAVDVCHAGEVVDCPTCGAGLTIPVLPPELESRSLKPSPSPASILSQEEIAFLMAR